ncbi:hypothetical protein ACVIAJ_04075 [Acinetobacter johnsonii]|uniref:Uncharacterized protein n=1 Tax=Acinetobacter johnsonii TaxID=40214 RepID=A0A1R7QGD6_ACIJO|nr:hypothetical protein [Acinetobacter johnsonii]SJX23345.1 hypothetical protein ACNJC6_03006 [Acinetobacter johnsonii]
MKTIDYYNEQAQELLEQFDQVNLVRQWITTDKRLDRTEQRLNLIIQKIIIKEQYPNSTQ